MLTLFPTSQASLATVTTVLTEAALKGAVLVAFAALAAYLLRGRSAASRHAVWTAAVIGHLTIPAFALLLPAWTMPIFPAAGWMRPSSGAVPTYDLTLSGSAESKAEPVASGQPVQPPVQPRVQQPAPKSEAVASVPSAQTPSGVAATSERATASFLGEAVSRIGTLPIVAAIWFAGALLVLLRLAVGTWRVGQLAREGARVEDGVWLSLTQRLANRLGVTRPLTLLRGERLAVPVTWGIVYPAVLLPQDADTWSEERKRFVLVHEMAHVKRFDALTQLLAQFAIAVFWFDPLVWIAAHRMRVEREHACDDYVLRDGTTPSLYAGELLEMVRSIGMPRHDRAAPAFAALAMARRSEFEGRMLAILDPRLQRTTLNRRGTLMTAALVALLTLPLAALRPFQQPAPVPAKDGLPESFKISIQAPASPSSSAAGAIGAAATASQASGKGVHAAWACDINSISGSSTGTHIEVNDEGTNQIIQYMMNTAGRCAEAAVLGPVKFSADEMHVAALSPGGFARFRERTRTIDRSVSVTPSADGALAYAATVDGRTVPFDASVQEWLAQLLPEVLREAAINAPERVARLRAQGGIPAVLNMIASIHSQGSRRTHYEALLKGAPLSPTDAEMVFEHAANDLKGSSGDLSAVIQQIPRTAMRSAPARKAIATALASIASSGDKASTLAILAPNADNETLILLARAAETLASSGDKANFLMTTAAEYLSPGNDGLTNAYFSAVGTIPSSGDRANVLMTAMPFGHGNQAVTTKVIEATKAMGSSGDTENVLLSLVSQRLLQPTTTLAAIERTLTMASSGDRANVLISIANMGLLSSPAIRNAFLTAANALPSDGDRANVLSAAAAK